MRFTSTAAVLYLLSSATLSLAVALPDTTPWLQRRADLVINDLPNEDVYCLDIEGKCKTNPFRETCIAFAN